MTKVVDVESSVTGVVWKIEAAVGATVAEGDPIVTVESMKMEIPVTAPEDGEIIEILVAEDEQVEEGKPIARMRV